MKHVIRAELNRIELPSRDRRVVAYLDDGSVKRLRGKAAKRKWEDHISPKMFLTLTRRTAVPPKNIRIPWADRFVVKAEFDKPQQGENSLIITLGDGAVERFSGADADHRWIDLFELMWITDTTFVKVAPDNVEVPWG